MTFPVSTVLEVVTLVCCMELLFLSRESGSSPSERSVRQAGVHRTCIYISCLSPSCKDFWMKSARPTRRTASMSFEDCDRAQCYAFRLKPSFRAPRLPSRNAAPPTSSHTSPGYSTSAIHATPSRSISSSPPVHSRTRARCWRRCCEFVWHP